MDKTVYMFATSGGHYGELRQWSLDIQGKKKFFIDGPKSHDLGDEVTKLKKIDNVVGGIFTAFYLIIKGEARAPKVFISAGAQNALTALILSLYYRVPYIYVESFQRTENLSRAGLFSILFAKRVFLFHPLKYSSFPFYVRISLRLRDNIDLMEEVFAKW